MTVASSLRRRVDSVPAMVGLAVGDLLAITVFVVVGEISHGVDPVGQFDRVLGTLLPFLIGLGIVGIGGRLYTMHSIRSPGHAVSMILPAWVGAVIVAQLLRATAVFPGDAAITFAVVSVGVGGVLLISWRAIAAAVI